MCVFNSCALWQFSNYSIAIVHQLLLENATALSERRQVLYRWFCQFIGQVTFACFAFIFPLRNITLGGYLDTHRKHLEHLWNDVRPEKKKKKIIYIYI